MGERCSDVPVVGAVYAAGECDPGALGQQHLGVGPAAGYQELAGCR